MLVRQLGAEPVIDDSLEARMVDDSAGCRGLPKARSTLLYRPRLRFDAVFRSPSGRAW